MLTRLRRPNSGQSMVEFALVTPLLLLTFWGIIEFGWLVYSNHEVTNAARDGARWASVHGDRSGDVATTILVKDYLLDHINVIDPNTLNVNLTKLDGNMKVGSRVRIDVAYPFHPLLGFAMPGAVMNLRSYSTMIVHY
jgi:hypothetical protein